MARGYKMNRNKSKRTFVKTAVKVDPRNLQGGPMRGGYRI